jgi:succinoglycan biosynthesis transport protein ExoP
MPEHQLDLRSILGFLRRRAALMVTTVILVAGLAMGGILTLKPQYTATTLVLVDPSRKDVLDPEAQMKSVGSDDARVDSEVELVRSDVTLLRVVNELDLVKDPEFGVRLGLRDRILSFFRLAEPKLPTGEQALQSVVGKLWNAVSVQRNGYTYLISINVESHDPQKAATIANTVARTYISEQLAAKVSSVLVSRDTVQGRITEASKAVSISEQ